MLGYFVIFLLVTLTHPTSMLGSEACLRKKLLQDYDKWARPVRNFSTAVELVFSAALYQHLGFDVKAETLKTLIWQRLTWTDELMRWDPKQHNNIDEARFSFEKIWVPDLLPYNDIGTYDSSRFKANLPLSVKSDGTVNWNSPVLMETTCRLDVRKFPFDRQVCDITFGPWQYPQHEIDIACLDPFIDTSNYSQNSQWILLDATCVRRVSLYPGGNFSAVTVSLTFKRLSSFFTRNLIIPNAVLLALSGLTFFLPNAAGERIGYGVTITLAICVNLSIVIQFVPESSYKIPNVCNYFLLSVFSSALTILFSTISLSMDLRKRTKLHRVLAWMSARVNSITRSGKKRIHKIREKFSTVLWHVEDDNSSCTTQKNRKKPCVQPNIAYETNSLETEVFAGHENRGISMVQRFDLFMGVLYLIATTAMSVVFICDTGSTFGHV